MNLFLQRLRETWRFAAVLIGGQALLWAVAYAALSGVVHPEGLAAVLAVLIAYSICMTVLASMAVSAIDQPRHLRAARKVIR